MFPGRHSFLSVLAAALVLAGCEPVTEIIEGEGNAFVYMPAELAGTTFSRWSLVRHAGIAQREFDVRYDERVCIRLDQYRFVGRVGGEVRHLTRDNGAIYSLVYWRRGSCVNGHVYRLDSGKRGRKLW